MEIKLTKQEKDVICSFFPKLKGLKDDDVLDNLKAIISYNSRQTGKMNTWDKFFTNFVEKIEVCNE